MSGDHLAHYKKKRDFNKTPEPLEEGKKGEGDIFVVQEHHASHLHYDLRLEMGGVLKSWAVPKGPPKKKGEKRLAIPTEDHPVGYADFEGEIPEGEYGAGRVYIWDKGTYNNIKETTDIEECFEQGEMEVELQGSELKGNFALIKMKNKDLWLFIKTQDKK